MVHTAKKRAVLSFAPNQPTVNAFRAGGKLRPAFTLAYFQRRVNLKRHANAARRAQRQTGIAIVPMFADISVLPRQNHLPSALGARIPPILSKAIFADTEFFILQQFFHEAGRSVRSYDYCDRFACAGECHIEYTTLFGMLIWLSLQKHQLSI